MTKEEYLEIVSKRYEDLQALKEIDNFYDYELEFSGIMKKMSKEILEKNLSKISADRRKKNDDPVW